MAKKKTVGWQKALSKRVSELRKTAEKRLNEGWERTLKLLPPAPRKAVKEFVADAERTRHDLRKRGNKVVADVRKRADRVTTGMEKRIEGAVKPLTKRLDVATRADVERLRKRLQHLEHRMTSHRATPPAPHSTAA